MKSFKIIPIALLTLCLTNSIHAQSNFKIDDTLRNVTFRIIDINTKEPIGLAHIINISNRLGIISDLMGYLSIPIAFGDSLRISAIGYNTKEIFNWGQYKPDTLFYNIQLVPKVYEIKEVKISRFSTYEKFLREVVNLKLKKNKEEEQLERLEGYFLRIVKGIDLKNLPNPTSGIAFGEDWYHKQNKKLGNLIDKELDRRTIDKKYNTGIVQELTGLSGDELYKFIGELGFEDKYLLQASDYEIREKILEKFKQYKEQKESKNKTNK